MEGENPLRTEEAVCPCGGLGGIEGRGGGEALETNWGEVLERLGSVVEEQGAAAGTAAGEAWIWEKYL